MSRVRYVRCPDCGHPLTYFRTTASVRPHSDVNMQSCPRRQIPAGTVKLIPGEKLSDLYLDWVEERTRRSKLRRQALP